MNWNTPGMDEMQMHRGAGFTVPDEIREQIITMDAQGMEVEDIMELYPADVVSQVLIESKVEGRNPAKAMQPMKFPQGQSLAPTNGQYNTSDDLADSLRGQQQDNSEMMRSMSQAFQGQPQPMQDPRMGDIMNPHANKYRQQY